MAEYRIAVIPGDGIGQEVIPEGVKVLAAVGRKFGLRFNFEEFPWGSEYYRQHGDGAAVAGQGLGRGHAAQPLAVEQRQHRGGGARGRIAVLGLQGDADAGLAVHLDARQVAQAEAGVGQAPLAQAPAGGGVQAHQGRIHAAQVALGAAGFRPGGDAAVGDDELAAGVQQQLVRVDAVRGPFGQQVQGARVAHADQTRAATMNMLRSRARAIDVMAVMTSN